MSIVSAVEESTYANNITIRKRRRRSNAAARHQQKRLRLQRSRPRRLSLHTQTQQNEHYDEYYESPLRGRLVDLILSSSSIQTTTNAVVRPLNQDEWRYLYETEILVDKLLGLHDDDDNDHVHDLSSLCEEYNKHNSKASIHRLLPNRGIKYVVNTIIISIITVSLVVLLRKFYISTRIIQDMVSFITLQQSNIIPILSLSAMKSTLRGYALQLQAVWSSRSYLLHHFDRIRIVPFIIRLVRRCIILEAWRHIWVITYKATRIVHKSVTVQNVKLVYTKLCPGWIRRDIRNMFQSMVQSHITGAVGGLIVIGGGGSSSTTIDSIFLSSSSDNSDGGNGDNIISSTIDDIMEESSSSVVDECANAIQETVSEVIDSVADLTT
jgi:hypothetical protein